MPDFIGYLLNGRFFDDSYEDIKKIFKKERNITILNCAIITAPGTYKYEIISIEEAKKMVSNGFKSAVGHQSTANIISKILNIECKMNRIEYKQNKGDVALVFNLIGRPQEGVILNEEQIEKIGYTFVKLTRTK